ncbi:MAG TPA: IS66 family transposase [Saprospiraceae bacterium]|nr:IS66 family transposase [Saprospiraceae bacterium]
MILPQDISSCQEMIIVLLEQNEKLRQLVEAQAKRIEELELKNQELESRTKALENQLNQNSRNSHKPPSSDGFKRKSAQLSKPKNKQQGGQWGHQGNTLKLLEQVDDTHTLEPKTCTCGCDLRDQAKELIERRQVFELPAPKLQVIEYQQMGCLCPRCGLKQQGTFPAEVSARVQYGTGVRTMAVLLNVVYRLPIKRVKQLFGDLFNQPINESTILSMLKGTNEDLKDVEQQIAQHLLQSEVVHVDESGIRCQKKNHWLHVFSTSLFTYLFVHAKRGKKAMKSEASLLQHFSSWLVHDCWQSYFAFDDCLHALCGSHLIRELQALIEQDSKWALRMRDLLLYAYHLSEKGKGVLKPGVFKSVEQQYELICAQADEQEPPPKKNPRGKPKQTKGRNLLDRLRDHQDAVLAFAQQQYVPFSNNQAERDIRHVKIKMKISGNFNTLDSAQHYARIYSFVSTLRKHQLAFPKLNISIFSQLRAAINDTFDYTILGGGELGGAAA